VRREMQAMISGFCIDVFEQLWCGPPLVSADPDCNHVAIFECDCLVENLGCGFNSKVTHSIEDPEQRHSKIALAAHASAFQSFEDVVKILLAPKYHSHRDIYLGMQDVLPVQLLNEFVGDQLKIFRRAQPLGDCFECHQETMEIAVTVQLTDLLRRKWCGIMTPAKLDQRLWLH